MRTAEQYEGVSQRAPISACVIARNEAVALPACVESLRSYVEEIVVVDTGSTDATPQIAAQLGARVATFEWIDDFSAARNFAVAQASQPFILMIDADERLVPGSLPALRTYCQNAQTAGRILRENLVDGDGPALVCEHLTRLHPNLPGFSWVGRIHEQLTFNARPPAVVQTDLLVRHIGYQTAELSRGHKIERNLRLLELEHQARPNDPYVLYQIGRTLFVADDWRAAQSAFAEAVNCLSTQPSRPIDYLPSLLRTYAQAAVRAGDLQTAFSVLGKATDLFPDYTDLYFTYGLALMETGDPTFLNEVRSVFEGCLDLGEADAARYESVAGVGSFRARHNLGAFYEATGNLPKAVAEYQQAAAAGYAPSAKRVAALT